MQATGFLGGDISKGTSNFVLQDHLGTELEPNFQLDDNKEGHDKLESLLVKFKEKYGLKKVVIGVESTGGYENNWYRGLRSKSQRLKLEVFRINPKRIYHETRTEGRRSITDGVSAKVIAGYLRKNYGTEHLSAKQLKKGERTDLCASIRSLHKYIQRLIKQNTQTKNALEKILYSTMPEMLSVKGEKYTNWFLELLINYPSRKDILSAGKEGLMDIPYIGKGKAESILEATKNSVAQPVDEYLSIAISEQAQDIQQLTQKIKRLKKKLVEMAEKEDQIKEDVELITSISGIANDTAIGCLIEIGNIDRFEKGSNLVAFWGINPTIKQSGDKTYYVGMSKDGSHTARAVMYLAAKNVIRNESYFGTIYHQQRNKGKSHYSALGVVMAKLSRVIYGMLKTRRKFDPKIDVANQHKECDGKSKINTAKSQAEKTERRYQDKQHPAPLSMTQRVKRRQEQNVSS